MVKNLLADADRCKRYGFSPWVGEIPWRRAQQPTPVFSSILENPWTESQSGCSP